MSMSYMFSTSQLEHGGARIATRESGSKAHALICCHGQITTSFIVGKVSIFSSVFINNLIDG
jgi:nicotinic acid phosphoribosyltransferase